MGKGKEKMQGVAYLENSDFTDDGKLKISSDKTVMIYIFGSFCHFCSEMKPELMKAIPQLKNKVNIATIQLDGDGDEKELGKRIGKFVPNFRGVPMIVFFKNGKYAATYEGPRKADDIVKYVYSKM